MSRSLHTDPDPIRAARRVRVPRAPRRVAATRRRERAGRALKQQGRVPALVAQPGSGTGPAPLPRVRVVRPRPGRVHPAGRADIEGVLRLLGERYTYGLRGVLLLPAPEHGPRTRLILGRLRVPGWVVLYDQQPSPWMLPGRLAAGESQRIQRAGAHTQLLDGGHARVTWPADTLRGFMLLDVFLHELGHHLAQQYSGKRSSRIARTREHEFLAERFAARCRTELVAAGIP